MPVPVPRQRAIPAAESGQAHAVSAPSGPSGEGAAMNASALAPADNSTNPPGPHAAGPGTTGPAAQPGPTNLTVLLIEDDPAGSLNVPDVLDSAGKPIRVRTARNLTEAQRLLTDDVNCILLDLALPAPPRPADPDTESADHPDDELAVLKHVLDLAPRHAVLALTDSGDAERGAEAVRVGAQDYLFRDEVDGRLLSRAIRYAVERKRSDTAERRLTESKLRAQENARLERGLLPTPLLEGSSLRFAARYRPGRSRALLGGDFYDTVRTPDGTVHVMIGDVCGHGPDEAALGVELRIAWRALTFAGLCGDELLSTLQRVLEHERESDEIFATLCTVDIAPDGRRAGLCLAGHPSPLIARHGQGGRPTPPAELLPYDNGGPALGLLPNARWPRTQIELGAAWSLMLYTDGLIEGRIGQGKERLGQDGMVEMVRRQLAEGLRGEELLRAAVNEVRALNGGELTDDVAVLLLDREV
ncbi:SpoIIE family protein phosphatase [Streptomyces caniscabiei]|uniref:SpoIIE family protein phosphatase n=2 Tax=Streptomyces caniscabiei TaxID=2746961 RepID=A0A927QKE9_9ACTN|nr:response regulator [Streptomyces caniscabiei]MBD9724857.1 SpoIIE family protein phosphatase [Streptomyces caniscabiei]MDX2603070.1 SpoIIE family protein phosphatase [Streptomyces caniscabiei]MDX2737643.1 SpoIIE family protein phosphatase [Streptomyces caniscabiei]MDX2781855.1 SpoIIE family protein phosphatase [Streptomyces caniscabiei]MDX3510572.1 SpoIIE family protein phosphatase [Streptomyces caniscabiei]